jgi:phospholipid/cholesterol/gamma-HCH transport system permease protein
LLSAAASLLSFWREEADVPGFWSVMNREMGWLLMMGIPLVGLVHVGIGSSLSMQAYYGSTFVDGTGAVVGVGLLRNVASIATGMAFAGMIAFRVIPMRAGAGGRTPLPGHEGRCAAPYMAASAMAMVMLSFWGFVVGTFIGWRAADSIMGLSSDMFFLMFYRMIWFRDTVGLIVKGLLFGLLGAAFAYHEGIRMGERLSGSVPGAGESPVALEGQTADLGGSVVRATCLTMMGMLLVNMTWFLLVYHAVPVYGPSLLQPPTP